MSDLEGFERFLAKRLQTTSDFRNPRSLCRKVRSDSRNPDRKRARRGRIAGICGLTAPVAARFSGIRCLSCRII